MNTFVPALPLPTETLTDLNPSSNILDHVVSDQATTADMMDSFKVIGFLILAITCRFALTGSLTSPTLCDSNTSAELSEFTATPSPDLMDLSTAGF